MAGVGGGGSGEDVEGAVEGQGGMEGCRTGIEGVSGRVLRQQHQV